MAMDTTEKKADRKQPGQTVEMHDTHREPSGRFRKIGISVDEQLLERIDKNARRMGLNRSAFMSVAASLFMDNLLETRRRE